MNKKRKILTVVALAVFGAIIFLHYCDPSEAIFYEKLFGRTQDGYAHRVIWDVPMPLFVLAVFYTGLFFILGESTTPTKFKPKPKPDE
jgi:hypothetical protein